jgi:flavin-dependent dehydrogenase
MTQDKTDVLVIGGGPAGTTFANLAAKRGLEVILLEKDKHPRFHIGESLLPMNLPIFERLGILDEVKNIGVPKLGADFTAAKSSARYETFYFGKALGESPDHAFEVRRSEFDQLLFEHCRAAGVHALERTKVTAVERLDNGNHRVKAVDSGGEEFSWETRFVVDASGRDTFMSSSNGWKKRNPKHASAAVFAHYRGVKRRAGEDQGNISLYWFDHGWIWMIPLQDDIMSIGAVCCPDYIKARREPLDEFLLNTLDRMVSIRARMREAEAVTPAQATGNYSYFSDRMCGPGFLMVGDAFAFIDPVFSSGVYLAMNSAERGLEVAQTWLAGNKKSYRRVCRRYRRETQKGLGTFAWFIYRFRSPVMSNLFRKPRNTLQVVEGVVSMLAGDVYSNPAVHRRLLLFKTIYVVSWLFNWRSAHAAWKARRPAKQAGLHGSTLPSE